MLGLSSRDRVRAGLLAALGAGLAAGAGARLAESACVLPFPVAAATAVRPAASGPGALVLAGASGILSSDAQPTAKGGALLPISVTSLELASPVVRGIVTWPLARPRMTLYSDSVQDADSGSSVRASGLRVFAGKGAAPSNPVIASAARMETRPPGGFLGLARGRAKRAAVAAVESVSGKSRGLLKALLLGVRDDLDVAESAAFRDAGCAHVLSLSGQHLSILGMLVMAGSGKLVGKARARTVSILFVCAFVWLAGPAPALLRSVIAVLLSALSDALGRPRRMSGILALAFAIGLLSDPPSARTLSFEFSYLAMAGLVVLSPRFAYLFGRRLPPILESPLSAGLAAVICTAPVSVAAFGTIAPIGIVASAVSGPLVAALMWWTILAASVAVILPAISPLCVPVTGFLHSALSGVMGAAALVPGVKVAPGVEARVATCVVVAFGLYVYARPYADHSRKPGEASSHRLRLRLPCRSDRRHRSPP